MSHLSTAEVIDRFNQAFLRHDSAALDGIIGEDCVMVSVQPAPEGTSVKGRDACLTWWRALTDDRSTQFEPQEVIIAGDRATILWDYRFGTGPADRVSGVNVMRVRDGQIVEALGYSKTSGEVPLAADA